MLPRVGDVLEHQDGIRVVVVTEPVEITEADVTAGWPDKTYHATHHAAARAAQDSPRPMPAWWEGRVRLPGVWRIVGRE